MGELLYAGATHIRKQAEIDAARITQKSGNERRGAEAALQQFSSALANERAMDAAGKQVNATQGNIARNLSATTAGTLSSRIAAAEELGANIAMASAAGIGGSSIESYNATLRLSQAMQEESQDRATASDLHAATESLGATLTDATAGLDNNVYRANLDFTQYVDHHKMGTFERIGWIGAAAAAAVYGGPQAGTAVLGLAEAKNAANNGDFDGASRASIGAVRNGFQAAKDTYASGGHYWRSTRSQRAAVGATHELRHW